MTVSLSLGRKPQERPAVLPDAHIEAGWVGVPGRDREEKPPSDAGRRRIDFLIGGPQGFLGAQLAAEGKNLIVTGKMQHRLGQG